MAASQRGILGLLAAAVLLNAVLWLDSLDRYLGARYHLPLTAYLPDEAFVPSRVMLQATQGLAGLGDWVRIPGQGTVSADLIRQGAGEVGARQRGAQDEAANARDPGTEEASGRQPSAGGRAPTDSAQTRPSDAGDREGSGAQTDATASSADQPGQPTPPRVPGSPRILFVGDSMMQGVAPIAISSLRKAFPGGYFVDLSRQSTGLTMRRYFDWPNRIRQEITAQGFDTVVVFLGPNDPWDIYEDGKRLRFPTEPWIEKYRERVREVLDFARAQKVRIVWIGLPSMRDERLRRGAEVGNAVFREETHSFGFDFLSTEELIGRVDEPFRKYIEDQQRGRLAVRAEDGIHFTPTGLRLISARLVELLSQRVRG